MQEIQETLIQFLYWEDTLEKEMATHSSILAWKIPRTEEPGGQASYSPQDRKEWDMTESRSAHTQKRIMNNNGFQ